MKTKDGKVIYVDPYIGEGYDEPADLILVTHQHPDHNKINLPKKKDNCIVYQNFDALEDDEYKTTQFGDITVEAVEAYNDMHPKGFGVGYIISFDDKTIYIAGDTAKTEQMEKLKNRHFDYAFLPIDGIFTMSPKEATECAELLDSGYVIPYHISPGEAFNLEKTKEFTPKNKLIIKNGETIKLDS